MAVSQDRKYTKDFVYRLLESIKGKTLGEVDKSHQFIRTETSKKITGIAGDVIEQSVFGYDRDSKQECDIEIDGILTELKTTGVRIPKSDLAKAKGKTGDSYNIYLRAKEGISITGVTFEPSIQLDFLTSHFWEKSENMLIVFYEYKSNKVVPASAYADFPIVDYCYNKFSDTEIKQLKSDWEIVSNYLRNIYTQYDNLEDRYKHLVGFTHVLRSDLMLIELVPGFKIRPNGSYQKPRYRLKQTFVDYIVRGHFNKSRANNEVNLKESISSFAELDAICHALSVKYKGKSFDELKETLHITSDVTKKDFAATCILRMFGTDCKKLNQISDFTKAGIIAKTITMTPQGGRTEDMKLKRINFDEWTDRDIDFENSEVYNYFAEHSLLCPIFCERGNTKRMLMTNAKAQEQEDKRVIAEIGKTTFEGFKRFAFDEAFIENEVKRTWEDSRNLIFSNQLQWVYEYDNNGNKKKNRSGSYKGAPNFPKSSEYELFFRGGASDSSTTAKTETVNGIRILPQFFWLKGATVIKILNNIDYL